MRLLLYIRENSSGSLDLVHLSSKYRFSLEKDSDTQVLAYKENDNYIESFYGEQIVDFSAIVGSNAVGKTTLIKEIAKKSESIFMNISLNSENECLIYEDNAGNWFYSNSFLDISNLENWNEKICDKKISKKINYPDLKSSLFFYSPTLEITNRKIFTQNTDCSTSNILSNADIENMKFYENSYEKLVRGDLERQVKFIANYKEDMSSLMTIPKKIDCEINIDVDILESLKSFTEFEERLTNSNVFKNYIELWLKIKKEVLEIEELEIKEGIDKYWQYQVENFFIKNLLLIFPVETVIHSNETPNIYNDKLKELTYLYQKLNHFFDLQLKEGKWINRTDYSEFLYESFNELIFKSTEEVEIAIYKTVTLDFKDTFIELFLTSFGKLYMEDLSKVLTFRWQGISSGENTLLNLFSRFEVSNPNELEDNIIVFIDEMDLGFHPKWQQSIIESFLNVTQKMFSGKRIQLILTTHSPLLLSNFRKKDVILMDRDESGQVSIKKNDITTFGTNLHKLLAHNFFLESALMGSFAKKRINEYFDFVIDPNNSELELSNSELKSIISEIGEPILRKKAIEEYQNYQKILGNYEKIDINEKENLYHVIKEMSKEIEKLKEKKNG
ncbi:MAG: AAA family ATPase [Cetobacterium sp.]|uniref:AAA family ATPase n=1 Tax=Cetobacterium sp. TaxID=2071632 RepID=UPI002FCAFA6E